MGDWKSIYQERTVTAEEAVARIKSGDRVVIGHAVGEPSYLLEVMVEHAQDGLNYSGKCYISNSACMEDAQAVARLVEERFPKLNGKVEINSIGTTIGSHTGPGTVALFFWGDERVR